MAGIADKPIASIASFGGLNQDPLTRTNSQAIDCNNVIGTSRGIEVWKGQVRYAPVSLTSACMGVAYCSWPDGHDTILMVTQGTGKAEIWALEAGKMNRITGDVVLSNKTYDQAWFSQVRYSNYVIGGIIGTRTMFKWNGAIDEPAEAYEVSGVDVDGVFDFADRVFAFDDPAQRLVGYYSEQDEIDVDPANFIHFGDCRRATKIVAGLPGPSNSAVIWGDYGVWVLAYTGSYPDFYRPNLVNTTCSCVSRQSIIDLGGSFAWFGYDGVYFFDGQRVQRIDLDKSGSGSRIETTLKSIPRSRMGNIAGMYHSKREVCLWSYPTSGDRDCTWNTLVWSPKRNSWWKLDRGWQTMAEVVDHGQEVPLGGSKDGIFQIDYDFNDDYDRDYIPWQITMEVGGGNSTYNFRELRHTRAIGGPDEVTFEFWGDFEPGATLTTSSVKYAYDVGSTTHPALAPGGPSGVDGFPPDALVQCQAHIDLTGKKLIWRMSNYNSDTTAYRNGPQYPAMDVLITGTRR